MRIRTLFLLACLALVVLAAPGAAQGSKLYDVESGPIAEHTEFGMSGTFAFTAPSLGFECDIHVTVTTTDGESSTTRLSGFDTTTNTCVGFGLLEGCEIEEDTFIGLPWGMTVGANALITDNFQYETILDPECGFDYECFYGFLRFDVDDVKEISSAELVGEGYCAFLGLEVETEISGGVSVDGEDAGTFGIE